MFDELLASLTTWIAGVTALPIRTPPDVVIGARRRRPALSPLAPHLLALYDADSGTVHLARDWDETDPIDQSVLLHALLHHIQATAVPPEPCHARREAEAYRLQALWLSQQGIDFYQAFGASPSLLARLGLCAGEVAATH